MRTHLIDEAVHDIFNDADVIGHGMGQLEHICKAKEGVADSYEVCHIYISLDMRSAIPVRQPYIHISLDMRSTIPVRQPYIYIYIYISLDMRSAIPVRRWSYRKRCT